jgi:hypothetical protein
LTSLSHDGIELKANAAKNSPIGIRSDEIGICAGAGGKGSHRKFCHPGIPGSVILSGGDGDDARHYQEKQVRNAIREAAK